MSHTCSHLTAIFVLGRLLGYDPSSACWTSWPQLVKAERLQLGVPPAELIRRPGTDLQKPAQEVSVQAEGEDSGTGPDCHLVGGCSTLGLTGMAFPEWPWGLEPSCVLCLEVRDVGLGVGRHLRL